MAGGSYTVASGAPGPYLTGTRPLDDGRSMFSWFKPKPDLPRIAALYTAIVEQARRPPFYAELGVPDTVSGRFEMIALHAFAVLRRFVRPDGEEPDPFAQGLFEYMFADFDRALREAGVGDMSIGKHVKRMGTHFYGRIAAYEAGLRDADPTVLEQAISRNLFGTLYEPTPDQLKAMADYLRRLVEAVAATPDEAIRNARLPEVAPLVAA
jgi:cytochrome b pre-mRNA-processing protein 3